MGFRVPGRIKSAICAPHAEGINENLLVKIIRLVKYVCFRDIILVVGDKRHSAMVEQVKPQLK